uniref:probable glutathione S-transferase n=1 Tax=Erigeron canadensis TaxID=72917 RepID=UPI001CB9A278|nr:probable glutathione S-transferase [Erigeron canadensis]
MAEDKVKLYEDGRSPYVCRVKIALNLKGITYENIIEDHSNKSPDLIKYNPVYKKVPVLVHNGNPISESLVIVEYIDDVWKGEVPILPQDPYEKAVARFWANFIDDKCLPAIYNGIRSNGDEQAMSEAYKQLQILESELMIIGVEGNKYFGGDNINLVDIAAVFLAYWPGIIEETSGINSVPKDKFPKIIEWANNLLSLQVVKEILPPRSELVVFFKKRYGN